MSENTPGTRPVTGTGKGFYCTTTAHRTRSGTPLRHLASFSKPFFILSGKVWRTCLLGTATATVKHGTAGERLRRGQALHQAGRRRRPRRESLTPRSFEADMDVIFPRSVPFAAGPRAPAPKTDADVIFQNTGPA